MRGVGTTTSVRRGLRSLAPLLLLLLLVRGGRADEARLAAWRDEEVLRRHLAAACDAVEATVGACFAPRPGIRVSTAEDLTRLLQGRFEGERGMVEAAPDETRTFLAYYDPVGHDVHIVPDALARVALAFQAPDLLDEEVLRVVLVHEATHALDFQRFPVRWMLACCGASDERLATEAVLEGHAQLVAEEVSRRLGIEGAFQRLTRLYTGAIGDCGDSEAPPFDQEAAFAYLQGHAFLRAVLVERGQAGVDAVLRDPPSETRVIDRPGLWFDPAERGQEVDLQALLEVFRPLVPSPEWEVDKWRVLGPSIPLLPGEGPGEAGAVESYLDNHGLYAAAPGGNRYVNVFVALCRSEDHARRFVRALRQVDEGRDREPGWEGGRRLGGAGPEGRMEGFTSTRRAAGGGPDARLALSVVRQGRHVIEVATYGLGEGGVAERDRILDFAGRLLRASAPSSVAVALRARLLEFLAVRAEGRMDRSRVLLRDLLPSEADLRRVVRPERAADWAASYRGPRVPGRAAVLPDEAVVAAFPTLDARTQVHAWAATTEELAAGGGWSGRFPATLRGFAAEHGAPGMTWVVAQATSGSGGAERTMAAFARMADRFVWIEEPWQVLSR